MRLEPLPGPRTAAHRNGGFTLVEISLVLGLSVVLMAAIWQVWSQATRSTSRLAAGGLSMQEARLGTKRMINELEEGLSLFYPAPGRQTQSGVGFLDSRGQVVMYYADISDDQRGQSLWRADVNAGEKEELVRGLRHFRATVMPAAPGREASCVSLDLCVGEAGSSGSNPAVYNVVTSVFIRGLQKDIPATGEAMP